MVTIMDDYNKGVVFAVAIMIISLIIFGILKLNDMPKYRITMNEIEGKEIYYTASDRLFKFIPFLWFEWNRQHDTYEEALEWIVEKNLIPPKPIKKHTYPE